MANQAPDRREVMAMLARVAAISQFPGFSRWMCATEHASGHSAHPGAESYKPQFFTTPEYKMLDQITELIIPRDESPGARDAGVSEFIDFIVAHDREMQFPFRTGLASLNAIATQGYGRDFSELAESRQEDILRRLAYHDRQLPADLEEQKFFSLVRRYTVMGYYTSRVGLQQLDYPGLKFYAASPECPHKDDPEHRHLAAARI